KTFRLGARLLPGQPGQRLGLLEKRRALLVGPGIAGLQNHVAVVILVNRHIPLKVHLSQLWEAFYLQAAGHIAPHPAGTRLRLHAGSRILRPARHAALRALALARIDVHIGLLDDALGLAVFLQDLDDVLARRIGAEWADAPGLLHADPMAVAV